MMVGKPNILRASFVLVAVLVVFVSAARAQDRGQAPEMLESGLKPEDVEKRSYVDYARECIGLLMSHGTDTYGRIHAPILVSILDVRTRTCPENPLPFDEAFRVIRRGRRAPAGGNLYPDQPTLRAMYALSQITGDRQYAAFADNYLNYTMRNLVDEKGLFWWGWHRHYDAYLDVMTGHNGNPHEIHIQQAIWPELWRVNKEAVTREIEAIWQWHVINKTTGECNRHGDGQRGCDFAMTGGEILGAFAFLYSVTHDRQWLDRARLVADYYWRSRNPTTNLIPNRPNAGADRFDGARFDTSITGLHCHSLLKAFELTGEPTFREYALAYLKAYARYGYDREAGQFWGSLRLDGSPVREARGGSGYEQYEPRGHVDIWQPYAAGYEHPIPTAQAYAYAYQITGDKDVLEAAKRWAKCIRRVFPPRACNEDTWYRGYARDYAPHGTYADHYGRVISFFLQMDALLSRASERAQGFRAAPPRGQADSPRRPGGAPWGLPRLTGDAAYGQSAREAAQEALSRLYYQGLLRGHPCKPYYEAMDGVGYLLTALIQLDEVLTGKTKGLSFENW